MTKDTNTSKWVGYVLAGIGGALLGYLIHKAIRGDNYNCPHCECHKVPDNSPNCPDCGVRLEWVN